MIKCLDGTVYNNYDDYIKSKHWQDKKQEYFRFHDRQCIECGSIKAIHLHHMTYEHIGNERLSELIPLCEMCHKATHSADKIVKAELKPKVKPNRKPKKQHKVKCADCKYFKYGYYCDHIKKTAINYYKPKLCRHYKKL